jgi:hypothetical protein
MRNTSSHACLATLLALFVAGCATPNIQDTHNLETSQGSGVVAGTITYEGVYGAYILHLESQAGEKFRIQHGTGQTLNLMLAFKGEDRNARLDATGSPFAVELPPGTYSLSKWQVSVGAANITSTGPTGVSFTLESGKAIYIGNYHFRETARFGRLPTSAVVTMTEMGRRDLSVIRDAFPALSSVPITQTVTPALHLENLGGSSSSRISMPVFIPLAK